MSKLLHPAGAPPRIFGCSKHLDWFGAALAVLSLAVLPAMAPAATLPVPSAYPTIQSALDHAQEGDTILVSPGVYMENLRFPAFDVRLVSTNPQDPSIVATTIIDGDDKGAVILLSGKETANALVSGFTIKFGRATHGGGIQGGGGRATISHNVIADNTADGDGGGIAHCNGLIVNNRVTGNKALRGGGLAFCRGTIEDNWISGNTARIRRDAAGEPLDDDSGMGGGLYQLDGQILLNDIQGNLAERDGGGIAYCDGHIQYNDVSGNTAQRNGGGIAYSKTRYMGENVFAGNVAANEGGGIYKCDIIIENNVIQGNKAVYGGGISNCNVVIRDNEIVYNHAWNSGGGIANTSAAIRNNIIRGNSTSIALVANFNPLTRVIPPGSGGGVFNAGGLIESNDIDSNSANFGGGLAACNGTIKNNTIRRNTVSGLPSAAEPRCEARGGGLFSCNGVIEKNHVQSNRILQPGFIDIDFSAYGGGLANCNGTIQANRITGNTAAGIGSRTGLDTPPATAKAIGGGVAECEGSLQNNVIDRNTANFLQFDNPYNPNHGIFQGAGHSSGGGIAHSDGTIQNNTVHANQAIGLVGYAGTISGGGFFYNRAQTRNNILWENTVAVDASSTWTLPYAPQWVGGALPNYGIVQRSNDPYQPWPFDDEGHIVYDADPLFIAPYDATNPNYRLQPGSPAIDRGVVIPELLVDYDGNPRWCCGDTPYDLGAFEIYHPLPTPTPTPIPSPTPEGTPTPIPTPTPSPTPTITPTPSPTPDSRVIFEYTTTNDGWWSGGGAPFTAPRASHHDGALHIATADNTNTFGYWESPRLTLSTNPDSVPPDEVAVPWPFATNNLFVALFNVRSDVAEASQVPQIRFRTFAESFERSDVLAVESKGNGSLSPQAAGKEYAHYFVQPAGRDGMRMAFDVLNFDPSDRAYANLSLQSTKLQAILPENLTGARTEVTYDFRNGNANGWIPQNTLVFARPVFDLTTEGLRIRNVSENHDKVTFGYWTSQASDAVRVLLQGNRLYRASFRVASTATSAQTVPTFRLRLNETSNKAGMYVNVEAKAGASLPVAGYPRTYHAYFLAPPEVANSTLLVAFDYLYGPGGNQDPTVALTLQSVHVESFDRPALLPF